MDIEQLKLVLETLQSVSHDASSLAVLWLWLKFGSSILHTLLISVAICGAGYGIFRAIMAASGAAGSENFTREMRDILGVGSPGMLTDGERLRVQTQLRELVMQHRLNKGK